MANLKSVILCVFGEFAKYENFAFVQLIALVFFEGKK